jgi:RHS repeat-associated protein
MMKSSFRRFQAGGTPTDVLQWRAKAGGALGVDWLEKVVYAYWQRIGGTHLGPVWSDRVDVPDGDGRVVAVVYTSGTLHEATTGVSAEALQYRVSSSGGSPAWPALRFPGHYADPETALNENWHRYYDRPAGRYLQPEPLGDNPSALLELIAETGAQVGFYIYANDNTERYCDPDGNSVIG